MPNFIVTLEFSVFSAPMGSDPIERQIKKDGLK